MSNNSDIHKKLMEQLDDLTSRLNKIEKDIHHKESPISADFAALENETNETIANIKNSLKRMEEGSYGVCAVCGIKIPEERIKALPYTDKCFVCADK